MKRPPIEPTENTTPARRRLSLLLTSAVAALVSLPVIAADRSRDQDDEESHYGQIDLVSDIADVAQIQDAGLVNAWGIAFGPTGPFWVGNNGTGKATLYAVTNDASGVPHVTKNAREVTIPGTGGVTGQIFNNTTAFNADLFVFVSTDGTISGWRPALGNAAEILATRTTALYTGVALSSKSGSPVLLAANFKEGTVDEYDSTLHLIGQFSDRHTPAGYAPFNVQTVAGSVYVMYAAQNAAKNGVSPGPGRGLIDVFNTANGKFQRFATGKAAGGKIREMNSPWGITKSPQSFGSHGDQLLVGNFGSGTIMSFTDKGKFRGLLRGSEECPVTIDGLWGLAFGAAGTAGVATDLYFSAGPNGEQHGLFGVLQTLDDADDDDHGHGNEGGYPGGRN
jgi:uncharacterized protein (TIGR03118 family)